MTLEEEDARRGELVKPAVFLDADRAALDAAISRHDTVLYPADKSIIRLNRIGLAKEQPKKSSDDDGDELDVIFGSKPIPVPTAKWVSVHKNGDILGLRYDPWDSQGAIADSKKKDSKKSASAADPNPNSAIFCSSFNDGTQMVVDKGPEAPNKPDGFGTVRVVNTCACGLIVENGSNGIIKQLHAQVPQVGLM